MYEDIFLRKKVLPEKLKQYGFQENNNNYQYSTDILNSDFRLFISISKNSIPDTTLIEIATNEEYTLYKTYDTGIFVGEVRSAIEKILRDIADKCYETAVFKSKQAINLIEYIRKKHGDELEYLWKKTPNNAIWRRKDNKKWYGVLLTISRHKLGIKSDEIVEIINLRGNQENVKVLVDYQCYYPGWHMNKKYWYTIVLDDSVPLNEIYRRIDESYLLVK